MRGYRELLASSSRRRDLLNIWGGGDLPLLFSTVHECKITHQLIRRSSIVAAEFTSDDC
jgi:hypothetical protein